MRGESGASLRSLDVSTGAAQELPTSRGCPRPAVLDPFFSLLDCFRSCAALVMISCDSDTSAAARVPDAAGQVDYKASVIVDLQLCPGSGQTLARAWHREK